MGKRTYLGGHTILRSDSDFFTSDKPTRGKKNERLQATLKTEAKRRLEENPIPKASIPDSNQADRTRLSEIARNRQTFQAQLAQRRKGILPT